MEIESIRFSGFREYDQKTDINFRTARNGDISERHNPTYLFNIIQAILFGLNDDEKKKFRGDQAKNRTFTGLLALRLDDRNIVIERDFETDFVACLSSGPGRAQVLFQGKDFLNNGPGRAYFKTLEDLIPLHNRQAVVQSLLESFRRYFKNLSSHKEFDQLVNSQQEIAPKSLEPFNGRGVHIGKNVPPNIFYLKKKPDPLSLEQDSRNVEGTPPSGWADSAVFIWRWDRFERGWTCMQANSTARKLASVSEEALSELKLDDLKDNPIFSRISAVLRKPSQINQQDFTVVQGDDGSATNSYNISLFPIESSSAEWLLTIIRPGEAQQEKDADKNLVGDLFKTVFENNTEAILLIEGDQFIECNAAAGELFSASRQDIIGSTAYDFSPPVQPDGQNSRKVLLERLRHCQEGRPQTFEWQHIRRSGQLIDAEITLRRLCLGNRSIVAATIRDLTKQKELQEALHEKQLQYESFLQNHITGIWRMAFRERISVELSPREITEKIYRHGYITECNEAFVRMYDRDQQLNFIGKSIADLSLDEEKSIQNLQHFVENNFKTEVLDNVEKDVRGDKRHFRNSFFGYVHNGYLIWMWGVQIDITDQKHLEEQYLQSQKMEAIGMLAGGIAHDFNNLLTVINGYSDLISKKIDIENPLYKNITAIRKAGEKAANLTGQLLSFSRKQILQPESIYLNDVIKNMIRMIQRLIGENIQIEMDLDKKLGMVQIDPVKMEQIIMNLSVNARDAMPDGGRLRFETRQVWLAEDYFGSYDKANPGEYVMLEVSDTGKGIDEQARARIFEPFFTTKDKSKSTGTGLGLATVYGIVKQSDGYIEVDSELGKGTQFKIYLPRVSSKKEQDKKKVAGSNIKTRGSETILVVEDEMNVREVICESLQSMGYKVIEAGDGQEALNKCIMLKEPVHLILTDVVMPKLNGREFIEKMNPILPDSKVLFMSGYADSAILEHGKLRAGIEFINKPFNVLELSKKIRSILDSE